MQDVLDNSLNTGVSYVVGQVGTERFAGYFKKIFGGQTGIDLPNEGKPLVGNLSSPRTVEYYTASFGQGVAISPVSMIRGLATLANKGVMPAPHVGYAVKTPQGISTELKHGEPIQVFSEKSAQTVSGMLTKVVDTALRGGATKREGYTVAAKTGTAQMALADGRGYYEDRYFHSFFGYFPATDPKIIILLYHTEPQGARYASETLTDTFDTLTTFLINHYAIPPDRSPV
jgi:cell division protein FtsI/penicillin-binding protein 2